MPLVKITCSKTIKTSWGHGFLHCTMYLPASSRSCISRLPTQLLHVLKASTSMAMAKAMIVDCNMFRSGQVTKFAYSLPQENTCECLGFSNSTRLLIELWCWCCYSNSATDLHFDTATAVTATKFTDQQQPIHEKRRAAPRARLSRFDPHPVSSARSIISDFPFFNMLQSIFVQQLCKCPPSSLSEQPPSTFSMPWWELTSKCLRPHTQQPTSSFFRRRRARRALLLRMRLTFRSACTTFRYLTLWANDNTIAICAAAAFVSMPNTTFLYLGQVDFRSW